jgi:hypothetical protein
MNEREINTASSVEAVFDRESGFDPSKGLMRRNQLREAVAVILRDAALPADIAGHRPLYADQ